MGELKINYPREVVRALADHEFLLSFNNDADAVDFDEWWGYHGKTAFEKWLKSRAD